MPQYTKKKTMKKKLQAIATILVALMLTGSIYATYHNKQLIQKYTSWTHSAVEIKAKTIIAHLWFEEIISGDTTLDINNDVWQHFNKAEQAIQHLLEGKGNEAPHLNNEQIREKTKLALQNLLHLRQLAELRYQTYLNPQRSNLAKVGAKLDQTFDASFSSLLNKTTVIEHELATLIKVETKHFLQQQYIYISLFFITFTAIFLLFLTYDKHLEKLNKKVRQLASFPEYNPSPVVLISSDLHIFYANKAGEKILEHTGTTVGQAIPQAWQNICNQTNKPESLQKTTLNYNQHQYDMYFHRLPSGEIHLYALEVTELNLSKAHQALMETVIENTTDLIAIATTTGEVVYMNSAGRSVLGISKQQELKGKLISDFHPDAENKRIKSTLLPSAIKHGSWSGETLYLHSDGTEVPMSTVLICLYDDKGKPERFAVTARDLTQEKTMQGKLEHTQRLESLGVLAGGIAHDFNNILTAVMGNAALASKRLEDQHPAKENLYRIMTASDKAAILCKQMLAYSGKGKFVIKPINMTKFVTEMIELLEVSISKNVIIRYELAENISCVDADVAQIQQVIMNLITNANESIEEKSGVITIITSEFFADQTYLDATYATDALQAGLYVTLEVSDTGCGMSPDIVKKIFDPFFTTKFTGRGLGMSAVMGIIRGHHGAIKLYTELGKGSTFKILLPASNKTEQTNPTNEPNVNTWSPTGKALVIDDDESIRDTASAMLRDIGFTTVLTAENGLIGVEVYQEYHQDIQMVLLDMTMPKLGGEATFRELRRINPSVTVILSSGYNEQEATQRFTGKGLSGFIQKPYLPDKLIEIVHDVCQNNEKQTDIEV